MADNKRKSNGWTLAIVSVALFMAVLDNLVVSVALPTIHRELGASIQSLEWTVNAYVLAYAVLLLDGRGARRSLRAQADVRDRPLNLHGGLGRRRACAEHRPARRRARGAGRRRRDRHAAHAHAACRGLPGRAPRDGDRRVVGRQRDRRRDRPARRRRGRAGHLLALDLLDQRPARSRPDPARRAPADGESRPLRHARPARPGLRPAGRLRSRVRARARAVARLDECDRPGLDDRRRAPARRLRRARAPHERADAADVVLRETLLRCDQRGLL